MSHARCDLADGFGEVDAQRAWDDGGHAGHGVGVFVVAPAIGNARFGKRAGGAGVEHHLADREGGRLGERRCEGWDRRLGAARGNGRRAGAAPCDRDVRRGARRGASASARADRETRASKEPEPCQVSEGSGHPTPYTKKRAGSKFNRHLLSGRVLVRHFQSRRRSSSTGKCRKISAIGREPPSSVSPLSTLRYSPRGSSSTVFDQSPPRVTGSRCATATSPVPR